MRALAIALCVSSIVYQPLCADEPHAIAGDVTAFAPLPGRAAPITFRYDRESLTANLVFELSRARIGMGITNILQIPEHDPPGGVYLDEYTLLTKAVNGIEIDTGNESAIWLTFSVVW